VSARLLRTIRLDASDALVFARAADPGQWAASGAFLFDPGAVEASPRKERVAFRSGFLGVEDLGWSTLAVVVSATPVELAAAERTLAESLATRFGAPSDEALRAAKAEIAFSRSLAEHPEGTLIAVAREVRDGQIVERFRTLTRRPARSAPPLSPARVFDFVESEEVDTLDLAAMARQARKKDQP
jgi:hypothetical protein